MQQQLNELDKQKGLFANKCAELLMQVMHKRNLTELMLVPLDCDGDLMMDYHYMDSCGEWCDICGLEDLSTSRNDSDPIVTRFGIIDNILHIHTSTWTMDEQWVDTAFFKTEDSQTPWISVEEFARTNFELIAKLIKLCLSEDFFWTFTKKHPGSRFLPFDLNLDDYIKSLSEEPYVDYAFSGFKDITKLDLSGWKSIERQSMNALFMNCDSLKEINLSGFVTKDDCAEQMFDRCTSLETVYMRGCDEETIKIIRDNIEEAELPNQVAIITD